MLGKLVSLWISNAVKKKWRAKGSVKIFEKPMTIVFNDDDQRGNATNWNLQQFIRNTSAKKKN